MNSVRSVGFFGECMIELQGKPLHSIQQKFAGDTCNTAIYFNRLARSSGMSTAYITALGVDSFSLAMQEVWQEENIDCRFVQHVAGRNPGIYHIAVDELGERSFSYWRSESAARYYFSSPGVDMLIDELLTLDAFYLSGISLAILPEADREVLFNFLVMFKGRGGRIFFDNNYRPRLWHSVASAQLAYDRLLPLCDLAFLTLEDETALFGAGSCQDVLNRVQPFAIPEVVIKQGADDCIVSRGGNIHSIPAQVVERVIDTTAAGDSFSAAYLAARLHGKSVVESAETGHRLASRVIQHPGAIIPEESMRDLQLA